MSTKKTEGGPATANEVRLVGRVSGGPDHRALPSGDELCVIRLVVPRVGQRARADGRRSPSVDVIDCSAWEARPRRTVASWQPGDEVEVTGALRRRFFRVGGGPVSRVEVEISSARRVRRAGSG